jgi:hypothetical protein
MNPLRMQGGSLDGYACELEPKARLTSKLAEIRDALISAGFDTTAEQAAVLGLSRSTAWVFLNRDNRAGPSAKVVKRILSSTKIPPSVRKKIEEYVEEKSLGLYGRGKEPNKAFRVAFQLIRRGLG